MHIVDGIISAPVLTLGTLGALGGLALGLRALDTETIPRTGLLAAAFFSVALIHVPVGPASAHLMLTGLMGLLLGWAVFPAILVGLILQALFFGFGGLTVLGVNTFNLALPALLLGLLGGRALEHTREPRQVLVIGFLVGALSFGLSGLMVASALALSGGEFYAAALLVVLTQWPLMIVEGAVSAAAARLLWLVYPQWLITPLLPIARES